MDEFAALLVDPIYYLDAHDLATECESLLFKERMERNPSKMLGMLNLAVTEAASKSRFIYHTPLEVHVPEKTVRLMNYTVPTRLKDLKANMVGSFITIRGTSVRVSSVTPLVTKLEFNCLKCDTGQVVHFNDGKYKVPVKCALYGCRGTAFKPNRSTSCTKNESIDWQKIRIQEKLANDQADSGRIPRTVDCEVSRDLVDKIVPGDVVSVSGLVKVTATEEGIKNPNAQMFYLYLDVNSIHKISSGALEDGFESGQIASKDFIEFSEKDLYGILEIHNYEGDLFKLLVHSICPAIYGHELVKAGILLTLMGGRKRDIVSNNTNIRSDCHILIVGDPGLGKSQMLMASVKLAPRGVYVAGNTSTTAGLTVTVCKDSDTGDTALEAGALVLGDQGVCCIDEFDKMHDHHALLEAMEQQSISIAKAGIVCTLPTRTSIIAAANPVSGHFNKNKTVAENLKMNAALLSRFDLIFILLDKPDQDMDRFLSDHIIKIHQGKSGAAPNPSTFQPSQTQDQDYSLKKRLSVGDQKIDPIPSTLLRKYISYARTYSQPELSDEASDLIQSFYLELRAKNHLKDGTPITTRQLESIIRLSEARARCELRDVVTAADARDVIELMKQSLLETLEDRQGVLHVSRSQMGTGSSRQSDGKKLMALLSRKSYEHSKVLFSVSEIEGYAAELGIQRHVAGLIEKVNDQGKLRLSRVFDKEA